MGINQSGTPHLHLDCNRVDMDNCLNSDHLIGIRAKTAAEEVNRLRNWKRTKERFEENKARIKKGSRRDSPERRYVSSRAGRKKKGTGKL